MRLTCPNCGAEYEIADDAIPESGRDVQCSNCGHTWFEQPGQPLPEPETAPAPAPDAAPEREPEPEQPAVQDPVPEPEPTPEPEPEPAQEAEPAPAAERERTAIAPEIAEILQQERAHEEALRQSEATRIESQPDLGLDERDAAQDQRAQEAQRRMERLRGEAQGSGPAAAAAAAAASVGAVVQRDGADTGRDRLPDIEEINSTLRSEGQMAHGVSEPETTKKKGRGFRRGFLLVVLLAVIAVLVYVFAPQIGDAVPQLREWLTAYVEWVDGLRLWLDLKLQEIMAQVGSDSADPADATQAQPTAETTAPEAPAEPVQ